KPTSAAVQSLQRLIAWRLDLAHVDPVSTLTYVSGGSEKWRSGAKIKLRAVSGHRDTGSTSCPGNYLYPFLNQIALVAEQTGLPKLYAPVVRGRIGGQVTFSARLSSALPWTVTVAGPERRRLRRPGNGVLHAHHPLVGDRDDHRLHGHRRPDAVQRAEAVGAGDLVRVVARRPSRRSLQLRARCTVGRRPVRERGGDVH